MIFGINAYRYLTIFIKVLLCAKETEMNKTSKYLPSWNLHPSEGDEQ